MEASQYSATETLRDGRRIEIRALKPADEPALRATVRRMSEETIYRRFFYPKKSLSEQERDFYLNVDFVDHVALVAVLREDGREIIAGAGRYIGCAPGQAEVAFAVDDAHQGLGIGSLVMRHLTAIARAKGLREFVADVLPENAPMLKVFEKCGLAVTSRREPDALHVTLTL
ncbi:MAG TPA: GNAT family N-acetyltransferase [Burkholderiales bacterium]